MKETFRYRTSTCVRAFFLALLLPALFAIAQRSVSAQVGVIPAQPVILEGWNASGKVGEEIQLQGRLRYESHNPLKPGLQPLIGRTLHFWVGSSYLGGVTTGSLGYATKAFRIPSTFKKGVSYAITVRFDGERAYLADTRKTALSVK